jgi:outer membrane protein OmpA-like peptidoglycan-associated protein
MAGFAQEQTTEYTFKPHWYIQAQAGVQETLGETSFGKLLAPNAQLGFGYEFNKVLGLRISANSWKSRASFDFQDQKYRWKWSYVAPGADLTINLTNIFCSYKPDRLINVGILGGIGANIAFNNDQANEINSTLASKAGFDPVLGNLWSGTKTRLYGRVGANIDFRLCDKVSFGIELQANTLNDNYNSKLAHNADWYFNALAGFKFRLGKTHTKRVVTPAVPVCPPCEPQIVERVVEVPVTVVEEQVQASDSIARDIFYSLNSTKISNQEMKKVAEIAEFLNANPKAKVSITGFADKGTGTLAINLRLAAQRAQAVADALKNDYAIAADRISVSSMTRAEQQPFTEPTTLNRVAVCVAK